jgi:hypothetical protein
MSELRRITLDTTAFGSRDIEWSRIMREGSLLKIDGFGGSALYTLISRSRSCARGVVTYTAESTEAVDAEAPTP